jgi:hypothetical protein
MVDRIALAAALKSTTPITSAASVTVLYLGKGSNVRH